MVWIVNEGDPKPLAKRGFYNQSFYLDKIVEYEKVQNETSFKKNVCLWLSKSLCIIIGFLLILSGWRCRN